MKKNIVLVGFMGTGKTSLGRQLARRLGYQFIDTDRAIEEVTGKTVEEIFRRDGEIRFRSEENLLVRKLWQQTGLVISTGGGLMLNPENVDLLRRQGVIIALQADPEVIIGRVKKKKHRPLLRRGDLRENVLKLLQEREGSYDVAEYMVDTGKLPFHEALGTIHQYLKQKGHIA